MMVGSTSENHVVDHYRDTFGIAEEAMFEGSGRSEQQVIVQAAEDYRRDRSEAFDIVPEKCALIIIDMQRGFVDTDSPQWVPQAQRMVPALSHLAGCCRDVNIPVIFTSAQTLNPSPNDALRFTTAMNDGNLDPSGSGGEIVTELLAEGDSVITTKRTYDAFYGTDLDQRLRALGRNTIIITGTLTNFCCEATARSGFDQGYHVVFMEDLTASDNPVCQEGTLQTMRRGYARVLNEEELLKELSHTDRI